MEKIDTSQLKSRVDLRELAGQLVVLRRESTSELSGPCPRCGGDDRLHVTEAWFFCRQCHPKRGDALDFVQWIGLAADFRAACEYLGGPALIPSGPVTKAAPAKVKAAGWQDASWQAEARAILTKAQAALAGPEGQPGRDYLTGRALTPATWEAWGLGYTPAAWDRPLKVARPAIVIPWQRDRITALKYRFVTVPDGGLRYTSKRGGPCLAFGLNVAGKHFSTLWLVEGELNALALWQALRGAGHCVNWDVVSFGSDAKADHLDPVVKSWADRYLQVIVWADAPEKAGAAMREIPGAFGLRSPKIGDTELDANALLQLGGLAKFAVAAWQRFDKDPAYVARLRANVEGELS